LIGGELGIRIIRPAYQPLSRYIVRYQDSIVYEVFWYRYASFYIIGEGVLAGVCQPKTNNYQG